MSAEHLLLQLIQTSDMTVLNLTVFQGQHLPSLSVNYVAINKDLEKLTPQVSLL